MKKIISVILVTVLLIVGVSYYLLHKKNATEQSGTFSATSRLKNLSPLSIENMRENTYPGSAITIVQTLSPGPNYNRYIVSYISEGLKIYGLLTVPRGQKPVGGWPVILFNHGYISPASYSTVSSYDIMVTPLAQAGFIVFKPDYRGNGKSEGTPVQPYVSPDYVTDSMNALSSIKTYKDANPQKIGLFGHSMGGNISLHEIVMTHTIKAAELMAGVVGNEASLAQWWDHRYADHSIIGNDLVTYYVYEKMIQDNGIPTSNPTFWNSIDPTQFVRFIDIPVQIQVGSADEDVPVSFSTSLKYLLSKNNKAVDLHIYSGADHNLAPDTISAMDTSIIFFKKNLQ